MRQSWLMSQAIIPDLWPVCSTRGLISRGTGIALKWVDVVEDVLTDLFICFAAAYGGLRGLWVAGFR